MVHLGSYFDCPEGIEIEVLHYYWNRVGIISILSIVFCVSRITNLFLTMVTFYQIVIDILSVLHLEIIHYMPSSKVGLQNYYVMVGNFI